MKRIISLILCLAVILINAPYMLAKANTIVEKYELLSVDVKCPDPAKNDACIEGECFRPNKVFFIVHWKQYWTDGFVEDKSYCLEIKYNEYEGTVSFYDEDDGVETIVYDENSEEEGAPGALECDFNYHLKTTDTSISMRIIIKNSERTFLLGGDVPDDVIALMQDSYSFQIPIRVVSKNASLSEKYYVEPVKAMKTKVKRKKTYIYENGKKKKAWWHQVEIYWNSESSYAEKELKGIMKTRDTFDNSSNKAYPYMYRHSFTSKKKKIKTALKIRPYREVWLNDDMNATLVFGKWASKRVIV